MEIGLLWFDDGEKRSLKEKIDNAVSHYEKRFGDQPTVCYMHPDMMVENFDPLKGVAVRTAANVLPNHFWVGIASDTLQKQNSRDGQLV